jgi:hypothetical protein
VPGGLTAGVWEVQGQVRADESATVSRFRDRMTGVVAIAGNSTGREMAATDFAADVERVAGARPAVVHSLDDASVAVVVGTLGESAGVEACRDAASADLDALAADRESFVIETLREVAGPDAAGLVAGSDRRGTAYGVYELSRRVGVTS